VICICVTTGWEFFACGDVDAMAFALRKSTPARQSAVIDVRKFGATGNGTDQTTAIQSAIDYAATANSAGAERGSGEVFLPAGKYLHGQITMKSGVQIVGEGCDTNYGGAGQTWMIHGGPGVGFLGDTTGYLTNCGFKNVAFLQDSVTAGHIIDFSASAHVAGFRMERFSCNLSNPASSLVRCVESDPILMYLHDAYVTAAHHATAPLFDIHTPPGSNVFNIKLADMFIEGFIDNEVPLVVVADDVGGVTFAVSFDSLTFEPGPGGAIEARGIYAGPTFTGVATADCLDTWPVIHITRGASSAYGYGPSTFIGCFIHNITADALPSCYPPTIIGSFVQRLDCQGNRPVVINSPVWQLTGTTNPAVFPTA
jgi:hypothetical protein